MLDHRKEVQKLKRFGRPINGITKFLVGENLHLNINVKTATFNNKPFRDLSVTERKNFEDLLYLSNIQTGNVKFHYL